MSSKLIDHALSTPNLLPQAIGEALLLVYVAPPKAALQYLQGDGKKWVSDIEIRRTYIDLLRDARNYAELRDFCEDEVQQDVDDWKVVRGWIDGYIGVRRANKDGAYALRRFG
jgi:hypothetical protein